MKRIGPSAGQTPFFSLLLLLSLSVGASLLGNALQSSALAQSGVIRSGSPAPPVQYGNSSGSMPTFGSYRPPPPYYAPRPGYTIPDSQPISGNVYQDQAGGAAGAQAAGPENVMILLDSSYSMSEPVGGRGGESKMTAAKRAVLDVTRSLSPSTRLGLRIYGNSNSAFTACRATSVLVPLGLDNRNLIASKMIGIRPTGSTPISYSVERSLQEDFLGAVGPKTLILISDGAETCGEDPCNVAVRMQQLGANVKINVVGLGLQDYAAVKQLRCVALATKGKFYSANTAAELANSLNQATAVETSVQGTILAPTTPMSSSPVSQPVPSLKASPAPSNKPYQDKLLPADVPKKSGSR